MNAAPWPQEIAAARKKSGVSLSSIKIARHKRNFPLL
jgi:hypothetical protein